MKRIWGAIIFAVLLQIGSYFLYVQSETHLPLESIVTPNILCGDGHQMTLINKLNAHNPSWDELMNFLKSNHVEDIPYELDKWICADYAETIHNQAEYAGIKAGVVVTGISLFTHAFNVFETTDKGFVYIDCTPGEDCEALDFDDIAHTYKLVGLYSHEQYYDINGYSPFFSQLWVVW